jgi:hypothetical protein
LHEKWKEINMLEYAGEKDILFIIGNFALQIFFKMSIDKKQLEINVNLHSLQAGFLNYELHYVIASNENTFRFVNWNEEPQPGEQKFYCFLIEKDLLIPAGNVRLKESYILKDEPGYSFVSTSNDFINAIESLPKTGVCKCVRRFFNDDIGIIQNGLKEKYGEVEKHLVESRQGQHLILVLDSVEISIAATMVYFRHKAPFSQSHYHSIKEEQA